MRLSFQVKVKTIVCSLTLLLSFLAAEAQVADFSFEQTSSCYPQTTSFTDKSTGTITKWEWDFGNGNTSTYTSPPSSIGAAYTQPGTYVVKLTVHPSGNSKTVELVVHEKPVAEFSFDQHQSTCAPLTVNFINESTDPGQAGLEFTWIFGDGGSSRDENPEYIYTIPGNYSVTLVVENEFGCETTALKTGIIDVTGPVGDFDLDVDGSLCTVPATLNFKANGDNSSGLQFHWEYGDGQEGFGVETSHVYTEIGNYTTKLTVEDANGCTSVSTEDVWVGTAGGVTMSVSKEKFCVGEIISLSQTITGTVESLSWDFDDGSFATQINPTKSYSQAGKYLITLSVQLAGKECVSKVTHEVEVTPIPSPDFTYTSNCAGEVTFTNTSKNSSSWSWNFGDNSATSTVKSPKHTYSVRKSYSVILTATNNLGCSAMLQKAVTVSPLPYAGFLPLATQDCSDTPTLSGCAPFDLELTNTSFASAGIKTVEWDFGDGTTSNDAAAKLSHTYTTAGSYNIKLTITDATGCKNDSKGVVKVADVVPTVNFTIDQTTVCPGQELTFSNSTNDANFFCWDMGDNTLLNSKDVVYRYNIPGTYTVTLKAKNAGCESVFVLENAITVLGPYADFQMDKSCEQPFDAQFENTSQDFDSFVWDFGDGTLDSTSMEPDHHYENEGVFFASLTVKNTNTGCEVKALGGLIIQDIKADFDIDKVNICLNDSVYLTDASSHAISFDWNFGNGNATSIKPNTSTAYSTPGEYSINLKVRDSDGCEDEKTILVNVLDIQADYSTTIESFCDSLLVAFTDLSVGSPSIDQWEWNFGDNKKSNDKNPEHIYYDNGNYTIRLKLTNTDGNFCELVRVDDVIFKSPNPDFTLFDFGYCTGESVLFTNITQGNYEYTWDFGNGTTSTEVHPITSYEELGEYTVKLVAKDELGCEDEIIKQNIIAVTKPTSSFYLGDSFSECPPLVTTFNNTSEGAISWKWTFGDTRSSVIESPLHAFDRPGSYDVTLLTTDVNGCTDTLSAEKVVTVGGPDGRISVTPPVICLGENILFQATTTNTTSYRWDFGDGTIENDAPASLQYQYKTPGMAIISAIFSDANGCEVAAPDTITVTIHGIPQASFTYDLQYPFEDEVVTLYTHGDFGINYEWFVDDSLYATQSPASVIFGKSGLIPVTLRTFNEHNCSSDTTQEIYVQANIPFVPNVFTPNEDGYNQTFDIPHVSEGSWNLVVYNRWGESVYEDKQYKGKWNSANLASGVYYYHLNNNYRERTFKGYVQVLR
jgi:gliding motility-associated-like protein